MRPVYTATNKRLCLTLLELSIALLAVNELIRSNKMNREKIIYILEAGLTSRMYFKRTVLKPWL